MISVVCPFYNEEAILERALERMLGNLESLDEDWELIVVDDGSTDGSLRLARQAEARHERLRVLGYARNRGRGFAIRTGVAAARGEVVVTTEIDCSWGDDIVHRLRAELEARPDADILIASPHLRGGGYRHVPAFRVLLSEWGNRILRSGLSWRLTMYTGMTRLYRRDKFLALPLDEDEKEQHLEIVNKALAFGYRIYEIPALLEWQEHRLAAPGKKRRSFTPYLGKLIRTHLTFSLVAAPFRMFYPAAAFLLLLSLGFFAWAVVNLWRPEPSVYVAILSLVLALFAFVIFAAGALGQQARNLQQEIWRLRSELRAGPARDIRDEAAPAEPDRVQSDASQRDT